MAYTSKITELNEPGFTVKKIELTLDGEGAIADLEYTNPEYSDPQEIVIYQSGAADDGSIVQTIASVDTANAQVDLTFIAEGGGDTTGADIVVILKFPCGTGADQDGTSIFGSGNTGVTF